MHKAEDYRARSDRFQSDALLIRHRLKRLASGGECFSIRDLTLQPLVFALQVGSLRTQATHFYRQRPGALGRGRKLDRTKQCQEIGGIRGYIAGRDQSDGLGFVDQRR